MGRTALNSIGTRRQPLIENGESSTSETQTTSSLALRPSPTSSVDATQPEKTGGPTSSGNGSAAVFGNERHSTRPLSRQLAEISRYLAASSPKPPATPNCRERSSLAQAPPLSFTPEFTPPKARKRLTAADFFNPESAPKYGGSDPEPLEFSMQDVTELIQEEKSRAADRAQQRTTQPLDIQDEQHAYGEESSDVDDFPLAFRAEGTNPKAGRNRRTTRYHIKQRRKHYDETMFSQTKPVFPAPSGANAPVVRLPRSTTGLVRSSALGKRHVGSNGAVRDARQRHSSPRAGSKRSGQDLPPEEPKRQRRETRWDQRLDSREDRGRKEMQRRGPGARHGICDSWRPRYDGRD